MVADDNLGVTESSSKLSPKGNDSMLLNAPVLHTGNSVTTDTLLWYCRNCTTLYYVRMYLWHTLLLLEYIYPGTKNGMEQYILFRNEWCVCELVVGGIINLTHDCLVNIVIITVNTW